MFRFRKTKDILWNIYWGFYNVAWWQPYKAANPEKFCILVWCNYWHYPAQKYAGEMLETWNLARWLTEDTILRGCEDWITTSTNVRIDTVPYKKEVHVKCTLHELKYMELHKCNGRCDTKWWGRSRVGINAVAIVQWFAHFVCKH